MPVDPYGPPARNSYILGDCGVKAVIVEDRFADALRVQLAADAAAPSLFVLHGVGAGGPLADALGRDEPLVSPGPRTGAVVGPESLAYILYTSGSTGKPKGVMLSHDNAVSYVDWCSDVFRPSREDRFSSHAPFHFDLSILDLYVCIKHAGTLVLIGEDVAKDPVRLTPLISERQISIWYSTPSILALLPSYGHLERWGCTTLRYVLFAGEVFPIKHLKVLQALLPHPRYFNLYGPTETNVCTWYELPARVPDGRTEPYPIGRHCSHVRTRVVDEQGRDVPPLTEGELCVSGRGVMQGYWNRAEETRRAFLEDVPGARWYRTGDIVVEDADGDYIFRGRADRMVKRRGYRIELGDIEAALSLHPLVHEVAVVSLADEDGGVRIKACLSCSGSRPTLVELKKFCADHLPAYMIPDFFAVLPALPKTSTDKIDYQALKGMV